MLRLRFGQLQSHVVLREILTHVCFFNPTTVPVFCILCHECQVLHYKFNGTFKKICFVFAVMLKLVCSGLQGWVCVLCSTESSHNIWLICLCDSKLWPLLWLFFKVVFLPLRFHALLCCSSQLSQPLHSSSNTAIEKDRERLLPYFTVVPPHSSTSPLPPPHPPLPPPPPWVFISRSSRPLLSITSGHHSCTLMVPWFLWSSFLHPGGSLVPLPLGIAAFRWQIPVDFACADATCIVETVRSVASRMFNFDGCGGSVKSDTV